MPSFAATGTPDAATYSDFLAGLITVTVVALVILTAGYLLTCWLFPFTSCPHPERGHSATSRQRVRASRAMRCRRCQGTGRRLRAGRRLLNHIRATRRHH